MVPSNKVRRPLSWDIYLSWGLLCLGAFLALCPEFVHSALHGKYEVGLISHGIQKRLRSVGDWLQDPAMRVTINPSTAELFGQVGRLGPGAIAIGTAEGTLNRNGSPTRFYYGHRDPANHVTNRGFASWQASPVKNAREADQKAIQRIQSQCIPHTVTSFQQQGLVLTNRLLVESCDIWVQAPKAAVDFAQNLKQCQDTGAWGEEAILCARVRNFIDPATGQFDVAAIFRPPGALEADQQRRMSAIGATLEYLRVNSEQEILN